MPMFNEEENGAGTAVRNSAHTDAGTDAGQWYEAAQDDLDAAGILLIHKKYTHTCFYAYQAVIKMLKALYFLYKPALDDVSYPDSSSDSIPALLREIQSLDCGAFYLPAKLCANIVKLDIRGFPQKLPVEAFSRSDGDFFSMTAYELLSSLKSLSGLAAASRSG